MKGLRTVFIALHISLMVKCEDDQWVHSGMRSFLIGQSWCHSSCEIFGVSLPGGYYYHYLGVLEGQDSQKTKQNKTGSLFSPGLSQSLFLSKAVCSDTGKEQSPGMCAPLDYAVTRWSLTELGWSLANHSHR